LTVIFRFEKFRPYQIGSHVIIYADHSAIKRLLSKKDAKSRLMRCTLLLQEFDYETRDKKGSKNLVVDICLRFSMMERVSQVFLNASLIRNYMLSTLTVGILTL